jgi:hypothetical protein
MRAVRISRIPHRARWRPRKRAGILDALHRSPLKDPRGSSFTTVACSIVDDPSHGVSDAITAARVSRLAGFRAWCLRGRFALF